MEKGNKILPIFFSKSIQEKAKIDGWPWTKVVYGVPMEKFRCLPRWLIEFGLISKVVPALSMDCIDILTDTLYFNSFTKRNWFIDLNIFFY